MDNSTTSSDIPCVKSRVTQQSYCAAYGCRRNKTFSPDIHFFRFPKDEKRCKKWVINCQREDLWLKGITYLYKNRKVCAEHFEDDQFMNPALRNSLIWCAVPTIFPKTKHKLTSESSRPLRHTTSSAEDEADDNIRNKTKKTLLLPANIFSARVYLHRLTDFQIESAMSSKSSKQYDNINSSQRATYNASKTQDEPATRSRSPGTKPILPFTTRPKRMLKRSFDEELVPKKRQMKMISAVLPLQKEQQSLSKLRKSKSVGPPVVPLRKHMRELNKNSNTIVKDKVDSVSIEEEESKPFYKKTVNRYSLLDKKYSSVLEKRQVKYINTSVEREKNTDAVPFKREIMCHSGSKNRVLSTVDKQVKITCLPNDFIQIEFAKPETQVVFKLMKKVDNFPFKCSKLHDLLTSLKERNLLKNEIEELLYTFGVLPKGLKRLGIKYGTQSTVASGYEEDVKKFATLLFLNSLKTYDIVSTYFMFPEKVLIRQRLRVADYWPGFSKEALRRLKEQTLNACPNENLCSIMFESFSIKKMYEFDSRSQKWFGNVDFGGGQTPDNTEDVPLATEVLMFVAVGLRTDWKLPFGYFMHKGVSGELLKNITLEAILVLEEYGLHVKALVCNGSANTVKVGKLFGCVIQGKKYSEIVTSFPHPSRENDKIYFVFGVRHTVHLLEKLLEDRGTLQNFTFGSIDFKFLKHLRGVRKQQRKLECVPLEGSRHLGLCHLQRISRYSTSVFSTTVTTALNIARELGIEGFTSSKGTINFVANIDRALCMLNARNPVSSEDRHPICQKTLQEQIESLNIIAEQIITLKNKFGQRISEERRWMSTVLFAFTLKSVAQLGLELIGHCQFPYFKTYRLNMDHFDMVMGTLQRRGGWEDVPTPQQFRYAYKQLFRQLSNNSFINIDFDGEDITVDQGEACIYKNERAEDPYYLEYPVFTDLETDIMHNATSVVGKVLQRLSCPNCVNVLLDDNPESYCKGNMVVLNIIKPSKFVLKLLKNSRRILKWEESNKDECEQLVLLASCKYFTVFESLDFQEETLEHFIEEPLHIICLVKAVIRCYFSRIFYARKKLRRVYT